MLLLLCLAAWPPIGRAQAPAASATVDFAAPRAVTSASGLLAGVWPTTPASHLAAVLPRLYRFSDSFFPEIGYLSWVDTARQFLAVVPDAELDFNLSNTWGFPVDNWHNGQHQPPWENWPA